MHGGKRRGYRTRKGKVDLTGNVGGTQHETQRNLKGKLLAKNGCVQGCVQDKVGRQPMLVLRLEMNGVKNIGRNANIRGTHG